MIYERLTPFEFLEFVAGLWGLGRGRGGTPCARPSHLARLAPHMHERCEGFSKGIARRWRWPVRSCTTRD